jgi:hypothetical protein
MAGAKRSERPEPPPTTPTAELAALVQRLVSVPDKLAVVQMHLQRLAESEGAVPAAPYALTEVCDLLHSAIVDVVEVARAMDALSALEEKCERR